MTESDLTKLLAKQRYELLVSIGAEYNEGNVVAILSMLGVKSGEIHGMCKASIVTPLKGVHRNSTIFKAPDVQKIFHAKKLRIEFEKQFTTAFNWSYVKNEVMPLFRQVDKTFFDDVMGQVVINQMFAIAK